MKARIRAQRSRLHLHRLLPVRLLQLRIVRVYGHAELCDIENKIE